MSNSTKLKTSQIFQTALLIISSIITSLTLQVNAAENKEMFEVTGDRFKFEQIDKVISSSILYGQYIFGGIALLYLVYGGISIVSSSNSPQAIEKFKGTLIKVVIGAIIVYGGGTLLRAFIGGF